MFTLLGVIALVLRERTVNKPHSDREEPVEKNTPSTMTSDGKLYTDVIRAPKSAYRALHSLSLILIHFKTIFNSL